MGVNVTILHIVMMTICYGLIWLPFINPIKIGKEDSWVGSLGISIFGILSFVLAVIIVMVLCNMRAPIAQVPFKYQLYAHIFISALFCVFISFSFTAKEKVKQIYHDEKSKQAGVIDMKMSMQTLMDTMELSRDLPDEIKVRLSAMSDSLRYISPNNTPQAARLEKDFVEKAQTLQFAIQNGYRLNANTIDNLIPLLELLLKNRKKLLL